MADINRRDFLLAAYKYRVGTICWDLVCRCLSWRALIVSWSRI